MKTAIKEASDSVDEKRKHRLEKINVFIETLTDIYRVKEHMLTYLPKLAGKAEGRNLRYAVLNSFLDLKGQILRLEMVIAILEKESRTQIAKDTELNLDKYVKSTLTRSESYQTDISLLSHLLMIEGLQITSFNLLKDMASSFRNRAIVELIDLNLLDTLKNKAALEAVLNSYF